MKRRLSMFGWLVVLAWICASFALVHRKVAEREKRASCAPWNPSTLDIWQRLSCPTRAK